jgi:hypothetical protein
MKYLSILILAAAMVVAAAAVPAQAQPQYPNGYYGQPQSWHGVLSAQDQQQFDKYYAKWVDATRKGDQDDIASNARHMQDIMARYNIPGNVAFDQVASMTGQGAYSNGAYAGTYPAYGQARLSPEDQKNFDKYYAKWMDAQRKNDQDDIDQNARKMQEIMARYNIPPNTAFASIAANANATGAYPYGYAQPAQRLSAKDQADFDRYYREWLEAKHKKHVGDIDKNARKMQEIMARYNIPANVSFDQIAAGGPY